MVRDHLPEYGSVTATAEAVGPQPGISRETLGWRVSQADINYGRHAGVSSSEWEEIAWLKAENKRLLERNQGLAPDLALLRGGARPPQASASDETQHQTINGSCRDLPGVAPRGASCSSGTSNAS